MREVEKFVIVSAPLGRDDEVRRWYSDLAAGCLVLTERGRLLEPHPIFGPATYRLLARRVSVAEANSYAFTHGFPHGRVVPRPRSIG